MGCWIGLCLALFLGSTSALYSANSDVVELNPSNFDKLVVKSDDVWIVEFYAPWCGHCQELAPEFTKAAAALRGVVKVGAVDADEHADLGGKFEVEGFPTIKIFGMNKQKPEEYDGSRSAKGLVESAFRTLRSKVDAQMGGKKPSGGGGGSGGGRRGTGSGSGSKGDAKVVVELTDANFDELVLGSEDMWLVEFYAPWCGHCKNLAPEWARAAAELQGKVKLGALDATVHTVKSHKFGVQGFPTIKYFGPGSKDGSAEDYDGGRTSGDIVNWALDKLAENVPAPEIRQLTGHDVLKRTCEDHQLCIIAVLPHILDCQSKCRNDYLAILSKLGDKYKKKMWGWVWTEGVAQMELEESLGIGGFGYPALAAVNAKKMKYSLLKGSFGFDGINEFLRDLSYGRGSTAPVKGAAFPEIITLDPWDGKDGQLDVDEEVDTSDVNLDDVEPEHKDEL